MRLHVFSDIHGIHLETKVFFLLADCLSKFTDVEELADSERFLCGRCNRKQPATKKFWIRRLPNVSRTYNRRTLLAFLVRKAAARCPHMSESQVMLYMELKEEFFILRVHRLSFLSINQSIEITFFA